MAIVNFSELMQDAERNNYAVGYFEAWNMETFLAVCNSAEKMRSPVILGFSGIDFPNYKNNLKNTFDIYSNLVNDMAGNLSVPCCTIFNESASEDLIRMAIEKRFGLVTFVDPSMDFNTQKTIVKFLTEKAHKSGISVEGSVEMQAGLEQKNITDAGGQELLTDIRAAKIFARDTEVDALAVNIGQVSLVSSAKVRLNICHLEKLKKELDIPLVLHGGSSVLEEEIKPAIKKGIRKINIGKAIKQAFFMSLKHSCSKAGKSYNPYNIVGSGLDEDILVKATKSVQHEVEKLMVLFGSAGRA